MVNLEAALSKEGAGYKAKIRETGFALYTGSLITLSIFITLLRATRSP